MNIKRTVVGGVAAFALAGSVVGAAPAFADTPATAPATAQNAVTGSNGGVGTGVSLCAVGDHLGASILPGLLGGIGIMNVLYPLCASGEVTVGNAQTTQKPDMQYFPPADAPAPQTSATP